MERNYVGFRRVTLNVPGSKPSEIPKVTVDTNDWDGRCIHLGSDAFLEFENMVWTVSDTKLCRGFIATPLIAVPFEIDLARANPNRPKSEHSTDQCMTSLPNHDVITNPITGLVVHPAELQTVSPSLVPSYTAVRLSATATNPGWWESNLTSPGDQDGEPQWVAEIQQKISSMLPQGLAGRVGIFGDDGEDGEDGVEPDDGAAAADAGLDNYDNDGAGSEESSDDEIAPGDGYVGPDVYPHRMRIWGLAISPGGGSTAVLATSQLTQNPERGGWHSHRSRVMFGYTEHGSARSRLQQQLQQQQQLQHQQRPLRQEELLDPSLGGTGIAEDDGASSADRLTTEARLWEWMYGGGPGVPGITHYAYPAAAASAGDGTISPGTAAQEARDALAQARRDRVREIFRPFAEGQTCGICDDGRSRFGPVPGAAAVGEKEDQLRRGGGGALGGQLDCVCENGHRVAVCGASGLAIGEPGISRCCGVCRSRCINLDFLVEKVLLPAGKADEAEVVRRHVAGDVCVRCGGKYLD